MRLISKFWLGVILLLVLSRCTFDSPAPNQTVVNNPNIPTAPLPADKSINQPLVVFLKWETTNAATYDIYFDKKLPLTTPVVSSLDKKVYILSNLDYNTTYYWKIVAKYSDGTKGESPVWNFTTQDFTGGTGTSGYAMYLYNQETKLPNIVNFMFQVTDMTKHGVTNLAAQNFDVYEDGIPLSSESSLQITKRDQLPYKLQTVLMLDNSSSLTDNITSIRNGAVRFVQNILPGQEVAIYQFSENPELLQDFTSDKALLLKALDKYQPGYNTTNLYGSVVVGASRWDDRYTTDDVLQGTMIIFTDGKETSHPTQNALAEALNAVSKKIVFTIGYGGKDQLDADVLTALGTAGSFSSTDITQVENQFVEIQKSISDYVNSFYLMTYKSPRRGGGDYTLTIRIKNNAYTGDGSYITGKYNSTGFYSGKIIGW